MSESTWKSFLHGSLPASVEQEIDQFETEIQMRSQGKIDEKVFAESRLRRGVYGQRYDNGQRHDGRGVQTLEFPSEDLTKGPNTLWDAPGMQRIKIPFGELTASQLEVLAELAEEYSDAILHVTTRQDFQLHFVHIEDTPDLMRRLAAVGITTREACGNSVRNVCGCPLSGVCRTESFDTTPYAKAVTLFLLGHPDAQDFGRKFKISFSGCSEQACGLAKMHDLGFVAKTRVEDGELRRGFEVYVGGGLGAVPQEAKLLDPFLPPEELLPVSQAICRVFARHGEKRNRARARIKFLVKKLGFETFRDMVLEERKTLPHDPRWTELLPESPPAALGATAFEPEVPEARAVEPGPFVEAYEAWQARQDGPATEAAPKVSGPYPEGFEAWAETNVSPQAQNGYFTVTLNLPLGDLTSEQARGLAALSRRYCGGLMRTSVEQNMLLRWISGADLVRVYEDLAAVSLARPGAGTIIDITSCPGTDTCKLGLSSSRGLAAELGERLAVQSHQLDAAVKGLRIKVSGCFNSCGQHHVADIGFYGVSRKAGQYTVPHFQVVLGGQWLDNAGAYGLPMGAVPAKRIPEVVTRITERYATEKVSDETFQEFVRRVGKAEVKKAIKDLTAIPGHDEDPTFYTDWGDAREYTIADLGVGECAGEVVSLVDFGLAASERVAFEAQEAFDSGSYDRAAKEAYRAMLEAAGAIARTADENLGREPDAVVEAFRLHFHDTGVFHDPFAGAKFANYLFRAHGDGNKAFSAESARQRIEEAQLFIEAAHACNSRMAGIAR